ncbi:MAG TPA: M56 family metallopeptidase, partial [Gammaproteobacteria bacterium]|nr:M56 family metallopeptidase [Gammaproteobacteria bacterium]
LGWLADTSVSLSVVLLLLLCLRKPLARWLGAEYAYYLWLLAPLHLLGSLLLPETLAIGRIELPVVNALGFSSSAAAPNTGPLNPALLLAGLWCAGFLYCLLRLATELFAIHRLVQQANPLDSTAYATRLAQIDKPHQVRISATIKSPLVAGWFQPLLLLPADFYQRYSPQEQRLIIQHEQRHMRRYDNAFNLLARVISALFWFHPLVYFAQQTFRFDQEISCDALVLRQRSINERQIYGHALVKSAATDKAVTVISTWQPQSAIKERIMQLKTHDRKPLRNLMAGLLLAPLLVIGTLSLSTNVMAENSNDTMKPGAHIVKAITPYYPATAAKKGVEGSVKLQVTINADGTVKTVEVLESHPAGVFDKAAVDAMSQWIFKTELPNGQPVPTEFVQTIIFQIPDQGER